jgi:O-antigen/teichoic acid export membrane protein
MSQTSVNNKRIAKNTLLLYFRMLFLMLIQLYTSRVTLEALGVTDYGIYNVVGGFVSMFALISAALTSASSRFLNYEMGKGDIERLKVVFSTASIIQWGLAFIVAVLSEVIGVWYVNNVMVLPPERLDAANWCFQFSVFNFCMNLITVPYNASIVAHERMKAFAYVSIYQGLAILAIAFLVSWSPIDRLVFYAFMLFVVQFTVRYAYQVYCRRNFQECTYSRVFDKPLFKHMLSYSLWHFVGNGASLLKGHGVNLVLNFFFGPAVNAARGIANQVDHAVNQFSSSFMMAMNPQITQSYARGEMKNMFQLVSRGSRFSFYLLFMLALPVIINAEYILHIWLKEVPAHTVAFVQLTLISMMISSVSRPLITAQNATGNVKNYQLVVGGILLLNLPLSYLFLFFGMTPEIVVVVSIVVEILAFLARMYMLPFTIKEFKPLLFLRDVIFKCFAVILFAVPVPALTYLYLPENFSTFILNVFVCILSSGLVIYCIGCKSNERVMLMSVVRKIKNKISI